jgi:hypothetical protein
MKFRKKPVVIKAFQWTGYNQVELADFLGFEAVVLGNGSCIIPTLEDGPNNEAKHVASVGDWIIRGVKGEFYPCKPDIFDATYEPVSE